MKKVLLSTCMAMAIGISSGYAQDAAEPSFPTKLDFTLNGQAELPGVTVEQGYDEEEEMYYFNVTGATDAKEIAIDFTTPEGWDGFVYMNYSIGIMKTRGEYDWDSLEETLMYGGKEGNTITFDVNGNQQMGGLALYKGDKVYTTAYFVTFSVENTGGEVEGPEIEAPAFPTELMYTLNGEKAIPGISVTQVINETFRKIYITGSCDAEQLTVTFDVPEGWDGMMISDTWGDGVVSEVKTRAASDWLSIEQAQNMQFQKGNSITYNTDGLDNPGQIALVKDDMVYNTFIEFTVIVSQESGSEEPGDETGDPEFPESFVVTVINDEGIDVWQGDDEGEYSIYVTGTTTDDEVTVVLDAPEGWDGFVSYLYSENIEVEQTGTGPRKTRAEEADWYPIESMLEYGYVEGNRFTIKPTGDWEEAYVYLCKDGYTDFNSCFFFAAKINKEEGGDEPEAPVFPSKFEVKASPEGLTVTQGLDEDFGTYDIVIDGETSESQVTVTFAIPEGWDNFIGMTDQGYTPDIEPLKTRAYEDEEENWYPVEYFESFGYTLGNKLTFDIDGEEHMAYMFLVKGDKIYAQNIYVYMNVMPEGGLPDVEFPAVSDLKVELSAEGPEVTVTKPYFVKINVAGECTEDEITVTVEIPEGFDGILSDYNKEVDDAEFDWEQTWQPTSALIEAGYVEGNTFTFPTDGERHYTMLYLYTGNFFNTEVIDLYVTVSKKVGTGVEAIDSAKTVRYYDLQGKEISKPGNGAYIKVEGGKASKGIVK